MNDVFDRSMATLHTMIGNQVVCDDALGRFPQDKNGNKYDFVAVDGITRFVELKAARRATPLEAARILLETCERYGAPESERSDNGTQHTAEVVQHFLPLLETYHRTIPYHPHYC